MPYESDDEEVLELFNAFILVHSFKIQGLSSFVDVELNYLALKDFCQKHHYDTLEIFELFKSASLVVSSCFFDHEWEFRGFKAVFKKP